MKRLVFLILAALLIPAILLAGDETITFYKPTAGACTTSNDSSRWTRGDNGSGGGDADIYQATKVVLGSEITATQYLIEGYDQYYDDHRGTVKVSLYTDNSDQPGTEVSGSAIQIAMPFTTAGSTEAFTLATPKTGIAAATYWLVGFRSGGNYFSEVRDYATGASNRYCKSSDGSTWSCTNDYYYRGTIMGCSP